MCPLCLAFRNQFVEFLLLSRTEDCPYLGLGAAQYVLNLRLHLPANGLDLLLAIANDRTKLLTVRPIEPQLPTQPSYDHIGNGLRPVCQDTANLVSHTSVLNG